MTAALAAVIAVSVFALVSCGAGNDDEILSALREKYPEALYLAQVIYSDVLPHEEEPSSGKYYAVSEDSEIQSIDALKDALGKVYTQSYIKVLENTALNGATSDDVSISAKFIEKDGKLYVCPQSTGHFGEPTELDLSTAKVARSSRFKAEVTVERDDGTFYILLEKYDGEWLIDSSIW